jgi:hypothetical protein
MGWTKTARSPITTMDLAFPHSRRGGQRSGFLGASFFLKPKGGGRTAALIHILKLISGSRIFFMAYNIAYA